MPIWRTVSRILRILLGSGVGSAAALRRSMTICAVWRVTATVTLPAGQQTLTVNQDNGGWNIYTLAFASSGTSTPPPPGTTAWAVGVSYSVGQLVTYQGHTYKCLQANTSQVGWDPVSAPALWQLVS
jgi:hypothetical protein